MLDLSEIRNKLNLSPYKLIIGAGALEEALTVHESDVIEAARRSVVALAVSRHRA